MACPWRRLWSIVWLELYLSPQGKELGGLKVVMANLHDLDIMHIIEEGITLSLPSKYVDPVIDHAAGVAVSCAGNVT